MRCDGELGCAACRNIGCVRIDLLLYWFTLGIDDDWLEQVSILMPLR